MKILKESIERYKHFIIASTDMFEDYFKDEIGLKKDINPYEFIFFTNNPDDIGLKYDDWAYIIKNILDINDISVNDLKSIVIDEEGFIKLDNLVYILRTGRIKKSYLESSNQLKDMAKYAKKRQKGKGWFVKLNAGNPEYNASFFNRAMGNNIISSSETSSSEGTGLAEDLHPTPKEHNIIALKSFKKDLKDNNLNDEDLIELKEKLKSTPPVASLGNNIYKFRWAPSKWNTGKSGATRVIYIELISLTETYLVKIFKKNDQENLTPKELKAIKNLVTSLKENNNNE